MKHDTEDILFIMALVIVGIMLVVYLMSDLSIKKQEILQSEVSP